ncbi:MAG: Hsp20/alpha crystallin family protein [Bacteroidota bacterium]
MINKDLFTSLSLLFSQENMVQVKKMINQFNEVFNDDFWESIARVNQLVKGKPGGSIPVEIWENRNHFYVVALIAGIKEKHNIKIRFKDDRTLVLKVKYPLLKPVEDSFMVQTEVSGFEEREVSLPQPVNSNDYDLDLSEGILTITLNKQSRNED